LTTRVTMAARFMELGQKLWRRSIPVYSDPT
jgi:hypothetical protein